MNVQARIPLSACSSALVASLVGFGGTIALVVQAGQSVGGTPAQIISAVTALCIGMAVTGSALSIALRMPIILAWSTPGAALIAASTLNADWSAALGAYAVAAFLTILLGLAPALSRLASRIPASIASAMLAGVLAPFCFGLFRAIGADFVMGGVLLAVFVIARQRAPMYALLIVLAVAGLILVGRGPFALAKDTVFGSLDATIPAFGATAIMSLALPLFLVTLVSQNLPGLVVLQSSGYRPPARTILLVTGTASLLLAPFGAQGVNLAAITAAICTSDGAHPDARRRWIVGVIYAGCYGVLALFSAPLVAFFLGMPGAVLAIVTGIALLGPLTNALDSMLADPVDREAVVLTFVATASGMARHRVGVLGAGNRLLSDRREDLSRPPT